MTRCVRWFGAVVVALFTMTSCRLSAQGAAVSHHAFDSLLRRHVKDGLVDYDAFERAPAFRAYLNVLSRTDPTPLSRAEQLAFWINAYNAYTIQQVNAHGERRSIKNINKAGGLISLGGAWKEAMATVGGTRYTLDQIEHERIRPVFREPRVHFALVCAALGCPPLRSEAYRAADLEQQLDDQARVFLFRSPGKNRMDVAKRTVWLSPIFKWYRQDFGASDAAMQQALAAFFPAGAERDLLASGKARIVWTNYDWSLNIASTLSPNISPKDARP